MTDFFLDHPGTWWAHHTTHGPIRHAWVHMGRDRWETACRGFHGARQELNAKSEYGACLDCIAVLNKYLFPAGWSNGR